MEIPSYIYKPEFDDNRDSENPYTVEITPLSAGDIQGYGDLIEVKPVKGFRNKKESNIGKIQKKQFVDNIGEITGLSDLLTGEKITGAKQLYEAPGMWDLVKELLKAMEDASVLRDGIEKNSV